MDMHLEQQFENFEKVEMETLEHMTVEQMLDMIELTVQKW